MWQPGSHEGSESRPGSIKDGRAEGGVEDGRVYAACRPRRSASPAPWERVALILHVVVDCLLPRGEAERGKGSVGVDCTALGS